jgi:dihydropyrimidinase
MIPPFDLAIRQANIATATDRYIAEIGIKNGVIQLIGKDLAAGHEEIGAAGRLMTPGGIDWHCHLDQPMTDGLKMADDFLSGTRSVASCGTTMMIPFAC